jgi:hypothetical protein
LTSGGASTPCNAIGESSRPGCRCDPICCSRVAGDLCR